MSLDAALRAVRALSDQRSEGQFLGYLGRVRSRHGDYALARECFETGRALLRELADPLGLGILLCDLAECEWRAGDDAAARRALLEAQAMAASASAGAQSELGQALTKVKALLDSPRRERRPTRS